MSSEQCSLGSILPPNYRHRAEAFARDLQERLWSLGSGRSSGEERRGKRGHPLAHPTFEPCPPYECGTFGEDSAPLSPTDEHVADPLSQLVNRSDGLPIPHTHTHTHTHTAHEDSPKCSFSSDSQQSIYSTPSENFSLAACALTRKEIAESDAPVDSCDLFRDLYNSFDHASHERSEDGQNLNTNSKPIHAHAESPLPNGVESEASVIECHKAPAQSESDSVGSLANSFSKISLNGDISEARHCENSSVSRFTILENKNVEPCSPDALDRNANELAKNVSESLNSSGVDTSSSSDAFSSGSINGSDILCSPDSLNSADSASCSSTLNSPDSLNSFDTFNSSKESNCQSDRTINGEEDGWCREEDAEEEKTESDEADRKEFERTKLRRSSSLKTWKTPPDTPGRKKIVRFADVLGLDLADVRTFMDEIPQVPRSAFSDLEGIDADLYNSSGPCVESVSVPTPKYLVPLFQQPGGMADFFDKLNARNVCLENAVVTDPTLLAVAGTIRVRNVDFDKSVFIRYSVDGWRSFADLKALYVVNSCDGYSDQFSFVLYAHTLEIGDRLEFAVLFQTRTDQFWDNNGGINYILQCVPPPPAIAASIIPGMGSPSISDKYGGFY